MKLLFAKEFQEVYSFLRNRNMKYQYEGFPIFCLIYWKLHLKNDTLPYLW